MVALLLGLRRGFSIYLIYMVQEYPAVLPYHSVASTDRYDRYFKIPPARPVSRPACHGPIAAHRPESQYREDKALQVNNCGRAAVAAAARHGRAAGPGRRRRLPGPDLVLPDPAHPLGHCLWGADGQGRATSVVAGLDLSSAVGITTILIKYYIQI